MRFCVALGTLGDNGVVSFVSAVVVVVGAAVVVVVVVVVVVLTPHLPA